MHTNIYFLLQEITRDSFQLQSRVLALEFWLHEEDFVQGQVVVKCVAEITGVYREETASYIISKHKAPHKVNRGILADSWNKSHGIGQFRIRTFSRLRGSFN